MRLYSRRWTKLGLDVGRAPDSAKELSCRVVVISGSPRASMKGAPAGPEAREPRPQPGLLCGQWTLCWFLNFILIGIAPSCISFYSAEIITDPSISLQWTEASRSAKRISIFPTILRNKAASRHRVCCATARNRLITRLLQMRSISYPQMQ